MTVGAAGPRRLLRRLRDLMAGPGTAQDRLDRIVKIIAADVVAEVCSVYLMRAGEVLELFATQGLRQDAVHQTRLRVGEGLVGHIAAHARPLSLADAQAHPDFVYRPETGEETFHSLMGVPIRRGGHVLGVLVVQNRALRHYSEEELEVLETVAMVVAELAGSDDLISPRELVGGEGEHALPRRLDGIGLARGLALGVAVLHQPRIVVRELVAEDPEHEIERLRAAVTGMQSAVEQMMEAPDLGGAGEHRDILETYRMFSRDSGWLTRISEGIGGGLTAEAAVQKAHDDTRARMSQFTDPYMRERVHDFADLTNRLLQHLSGRPGTAAAADLPADTVLVARNLGPAELLDYDRHKLRAVILEEGSDTAHAAIVARALQIPMVGGAEGVLDKIEDGDAVIVNGDDGQVYLRPGDDTLDAFADTMVERNTLKAVYAALRHQPSTSRDGVAVSLNVNAGLLIDLAQLDESGADGIGLYRTELSFMLRAGYPRVAVQTEIYRRVLDDAGERPVVFRTLDVGGDKMLPYFSDMAEQNPAMGWRALRVGLDRPAMLVQQIRALADAADGRRLDIMFPMIAEVAEFDRARAILDAELDRAPPGRRPKEVRVGAMLEVPSLLWQLPALLTRVDFLSVGSNDLMQFMFAIDRANPRLSGRYDMLAPSALRILHWIATQCDQGGVPLSLCGEMAGRPLEAMALIGAGFRSLSMPPASVGPVKTMVRSLAVAPLATYLNALYDLTDHSVRDRLRHYAQDHGVII